RARPPLPAGRVSPPTRAPANVRPHSSFREPPGESTATALVQAALDLVGLRPATLAGAARPGAVGAADRAVAAIVKVVVGDVVLDDVAPDVLLGPVGQRVGLPELVLLVPLELRRGRAHRRLLAAQPRDPAIHLGQRLLERRHLADAAAGVLVAA